MAGPDQRLRRAQRVTASRLFTEAYDQGRKTVGRFMVLWLRTGEGAALRLGVVTGRKVGGAVARVKARRRLRAVWRQHRSQLQGAVDVILIGRSTLPDAPWPAVVEDFLQVARRAGLVA
jgi:ribonuclease P protein component